MKQRCQCSSCLRPRIHVCSFDSRIKIGRSYANGKASALAAGRFSVFESTESMRRARFFTRLCNDPELEVVPMAFPWTGIRRRAA